MSDKVEVTVNGNIYRMLSVVSGQQMYTCPHGCGVVVFSPVAHEQFHKALRNKS